MAALVPAARILGFKEQGMAFTVTCTLRAETVERWIRRVEEQFLKGATVKFVGLDVEYTDGRKGQRDLPYEQKQCAAVLQLSVAHECLVFQIYQADKVSELLKQFFRRTDILFFSAAIHNDVDRLEYYCLVMPSAINLHDAMKNPAKHYLPSLVALANAYLGTTFSKNDKKIQGIRQGGWGEIPLSNNQIKYADVDARIGYELGRKILQSKSHNV